MSIWPHLADRDAIIKWADRMEARSEFPRLVRDLIHRNNDQLAELEMRVAEGTGARGYDGVTRASRGTPFVPDGLAVWELGTDARFKSKANADYRKRSANPLGRDPATTTFVFVTPRYWRDKQDWVAARKAEGVWADVRVFDVDDIEQALVLAPAVHTRFSEMLGRPATGAQTIENWWESFRTLSSPPLDVELVLAGRVDEAAALLRLFEAESRLTSIAASSVDDVLAFVAAAILSSADEVRENLLGKTLIVWDAHALHYLAAFEGLLVLVPFEDDLRREARLVRNHHVVIRADDGGPNDIDLPPLDPTLFAPLLVERGEPAERAEELARYARRSVVAFQRRAAMPGAAGAPPWANRLASRVTRRSWLVGKWSERRSGDVDALTALFDVEYAQAAEELSQLAAGPDPLFVRVGDTWAVVSVEDAWQYGQPRLEAADLEAFETLIQTVLGAVDPKLDLPVGDRWMAAVYGKSRLHSTDLREGVANTLALLGGRGGSVTIGSATVDAWLRRTLWQLFKRANEDTSGQLWASVTDVLPLLAEAAPDVFLEAVQKGLQNERALLGQMFIDHDETDSVLSVSSPHTGLLWALERLAWSSEHFGLVVELLALLVEADPGGRLSNRPAASLASIYRSWLPQTSVGLERRLAALDALRRRHPTVAWPLLLSMLPERSGVGHYNQGPRYRDWKPPETGERSPETVASFVAAAERLIDDAAADTDRWAELAARFDDMPPDAVATAVERLSTLAEDDSHLAELRSKVWEPLHSLVLRHKRYAHQDWAMAPERAALLEGLVEKLAPSDVVDRVRWLFDDHTPHLPEEAGQEFEAGRYLGAVAERRREAVAQVVEEAGVEGVLELARTTSNPWFVGASLPEQAETVGRQLLDHIDGDDQSLVLAASAWAVKCGAEDWKWVEKTVGMFGGRPLAAARILLASNDLEAAWEYAGRDEVVDTAYWQDFSPYGRGPEFAYAEEASRRLLAHDRPRAALMLMNLYVRTVPIDRHLVVEGLERLTELPADHPDQFRVDGYELETLLDYVRQGDIDEDRLGLLEWRLRPALRFDAHSPVLERKLSQEPSFFVEVLSMVFRPREGEAEREIPPEVASNAYRLLDDWSVVPGTVDGAVHSEAIDVWVDEAMRLCDEAGRLEIGLDQVGKVLAKAPADDDGTWPTRPVRDVIERVGRSELDDGFRVQVFNSRGVTSRGLMEGGERERERAAHYDSLAQLVSDQWPRTGAILRSVAEGYEADARRFDEEAERMREGLD